MNLYEFDFNNDELTVDLNFHKHQWQAWDSEGRFVCILAGTQGGKTSFGPIWLWREIVMRGPGDYLVVTPTYPLLIKKALPEFVKLLSQSWTWGITSAVTKRFLHFLSMGNVLLLAQNRK